MHWLVTWYLNVGNNGKIHALKRYNQVFWLSVGYTRAEKQDISLKPSGKQPSIIEESW